MFIFRQTVFHPLQKNNNLLLSQMFCSQPLIPPASVRNTATHDCGFTRTVDVHVDGFVVAFRLQKEQLGNNQTCHRVVDLSRGMKTKKQTNIILIACEQENCHFVFEFHQKHLPDP